MLRQCGMTYKPRKSSTMAALCWVRRRSISACPDHKATTQRAWRGGRQRWDRRRRREAGTTVPRARGPWRRGLGHAPRRNPIFKRTRQGSDIYFLC